MARAGVPDGNDAWLDQTAAALRGHVRMCMWHPDSSGPADGMHTFVFSSLLHQGIACLHFHCCSLRLPGSSACREAYVIGLYGLEADVLSLHGDHYVCSLLTAAS